MSLARELAEQLAKDTMQRVLETGDEDWIERVNAVLVASSPTLQEEYISAVRFIRAEIRAREVLKGGG